MTSAAKKKIGIFVVAYNAVNKLAWTLDRVPEEVWQKVDEVFLFDDCSTDNTYYAAIGYKHVKGIEKLTVHRNPRNLRYGGNQKAGYQYAIARGFDVVVMLHADGQYAPEALPKLLEPFENNEADMVFGSRMSVRGAARSGGMPLYKFIGNKILTWFENHITGMKLSEFHSGYRVYSCEALKKVPFLLNSGEWHFDTDILIQFHDAGLRIVERPIPTWYGDEICYVNGIAYAFNCVGSALKYRLHKARLLYTPKYDIKKDHYIYKKADPHSSHAQIIRWIENERPEEILEVGTGTGYLTSEMERLGCRVTGVEPDPEMADIARQYCHKMLVGDIETLSLEDLGHYDAVILGDILEHVRNPRTVLQRVSRMLKPGGKVLMSLPNVGNIWIRLNLLLGRFKYSRVGLLDESDLRRTLQKSRQLADSGLDILGVNASPISLPALLPSTRKVESPSFLHLLNRGITKISKTLFGYQFILICRAKE